MARHIVPVYNNNIHAVFSKYASRFFPSKNASWRDISDKSFPTNEGQTTSLGSEGYPLRKYLYDDNTLHSHHITYLFCVWTSSWLLLYRSSIVL